MGMQDSDESYVIDICDRLLEQKAKRQYLFEFLRGDPGRHGRSARLPVDAYYQELKLVIEYRERQHTEEIAHLDKPQRLTCSGCHRGEQRRIYDQRRRDSLPQHGIRLIELEYYLFEHNARKRLIRRTSQDEAVIREKLSEFLPIR